VIEFFVPGEPAPQGSWRHVGNGVVIPASKKLGPWRKRVEATAREAWLGEEPLEGPIGVELSFLLPRPKHHYKASGGVKDWAARRDHVTRPDLDKLVRAVLDGITGIVIRDDSQVYHIEAEKSYVPPFSTQGMGVIVVVTHEEGEA
jgi:crossover junction endodeoxyribonuclease RusA